MTANPACAALDDIDMSNPAHLRRILHQDKHTRIEGLCSEAVFMEDVVAGNLYPVTGDFWFTRRGESYEVTRVVTEPTQPFNELDYRIMDGFATRIPVSIAWFDDAYATFCGFLHRKGNRYDTVDGMGMPLRPRPATDIAGEAERDPDRLMRACDYLEQRGLLRSSAIKRLFANCWLGGSVWDIDAFTITPGGKVVALEVKQKFMTGKGTFGLNTGQEKLFRFLNDLGMPVVHIILEKPVHDVQVSGVDLLIEERYRVATKWLYTRFFPERLQLAVAQAPDYTSIFGTSGLSYSHIDRKYFNTLKRLGVPATDVREKLFTGLK